MAKTKVIKYKSSGGRRPGFESVALVEAERMPQAEEALGLIKGRKPGSSYEWHVAQALDFLGWDYQYQVPLMGGQTRRGGIVLDFLVDTPRQTPISVKGEWWHRDKERDKQDEIEIEDILHAPVLVMGTPEAWSYEAAVSFLFGKIGRG